MVDIQGQCAPGFEKVKDTFQENFSSRGEVGAAFAAFKDGECIIDMWAGHRDSAKTQPWNQNTLPNVWSTTKGPTAICCAHLVDQGRMSYTETVASHWPEFGANGKENITVEQLLSHQAGLCGLREPTTAEDFYDHALIARRLEEQEPLWTPGAYSGYHALTYGNLAGELVKQVSGKSVGTYFREEIAEPFGIDFFIGLPESEESRIAEMLEPDTPPPSFEDIADTEAKKLTFLNPSLDPLFANERGWRAAEIPGAGGRGSAYSIAKLYGILADGGSQGGKQLLSEDGINAMTAMRIENEDAVLGINARWAAGMVLNAEWGEYGPNTSAYGHSGWGGSFGAADPKNRIGFSYVMNKMGGGMVGDPRALALSTALFACL